MGFSLSLIGTFLVRSGVLTSVHAFANDPQRGFFILIMLATAIGGALALFAWRAPKLESGAAFHPVSRETALLLNNLFLTAAAAIVFLGTLYPLALDALTGHKISVGAPYFAITFAPVLVALLIVAPFGPNIGWRRGNLKSAVRRLWPAAGAALAAAVAALALASPRSLAGAGSFALAAWLIGASVADLIRRNRDHGLTWRHAASAVAHAGLGIALIGIAGTTVWRSEASEVLARGGSLELAGYDLRLRDVVTLEGPNYFATRGYIDVFRDGHAIATLAPEKRIYPAEGQAVTETAIRTTGFSDLYVALGDERGHGWVIRAYVNPLAPFIWFGGGLMALGGLVSLLARLRLRVTRAPAYAAAE